MTGTSIRNLLTYQALCGPEALSNSAVVTNMWSRVDPAQGAEYETELKTKNKYFKPAIDGGARFIRHSDTQASAHAIIRQLLDNKPKSLRIQHELVDEKKKIFETAAGEALLQDLAKLEQKYQREYQELERELAEAREHEDEIAQAELEEEREKLEESKKKLEAEKAHLMQLQVTYSTTVAQIKALSQPQPQPQPPPGHESGVGDGGEPVVPKAPRRECIDLCLSNPHLLIRFTTPRISAVADLRLVSWLFLWIQ